MTPPIMPPSWCSAGIAVLCAGVAPAHSESVPYGSSRGYFLSWLTHLTHHQHPQARSGQVHLHLLISPLPHSPQGSLFLPRFQFGTLRPFISSLFHSVSNLNSFMWPSRLFSFSTSFPSLPSTPLPNLQPC